MSIVDLLFFGGFIVSILLKISTAALVLFGRVALAMMVAMVVDFVCGSRNEGVARFLLALGHAFLRHYS